jgi:hypothetical protein
MAIRYSGDVEVRIAYDEDGFYSATVRAPGERGRAILSIREVGLRKGLSRKQLVSSEAFDVAAKAFVEFAELHRGHLPVELDEKGHMVIRRVFQAPCPVRVPTRGKKTAASG